MMREFNTVSKVFVKSSNSVKRINSSYNLTLLVFLGYMIIYSLVVKDLDRVLDLLKSVGITLVIGIIIGYIINLIWKEKSIKRLFATDNVIGICLLLSLVLVDTNIVVRILAIVITLIIKKVWKGINLGACVYGILIVLLYRYFNGDMDTPLMILREINYIGTYDEIVRGNVMELLLGGYYLSPVIGIIAFIYLFFKKVIKYNVVVSYLLTVFGIMLVFGLVNGMSIWYGLFQIATGNLLFLCVYCLTDHVVSPTISEGQIVYGIVLGVITVILRFIVPDMAVIIALLIGQLVISKFLDKISVKLKYDKKFNIVSMIVCILLVVMTMGGLLLVF